MKFLLHRVFVMIAFCLLLHSENGAAQVFLNEICPSNSNTIANTNGDYDDWIELYNAGASGVNLEGYGLSDDSTDHFKFRFPSFVLDPGNFVLVFASGKNKTPITDHWETAVNAGATWKYFVGSSQPDPNWRNATFNDQTWLSGAGGIGYGYANAATTITPNPFRSLMLRKKFNIADTAQILQAILHIDFDDAYVAYLNGVEISRANIGSPGVLPAYNALALSSHQARMYLGQDPDSIFIDPAIFKNALLPDTNVLAIEVHNSTPTSNDILAIPYLSFGVCSNHFTYSIPPAFFHAPSGEYFNANFKLSRSGETLYLSNASNQVLDQRSFLDIDLDHSIGRIPNGSTTWCFINQPTPDSSNNSSTCFAGYATVPLYSLPTGFYPSSRTLTLSTGMPGSTIHYTTDGSTPTFSSPTFSGAISLDTTQTVRASVFASGFLPSPVISNSYFINEDVHLPVFSLNTDPANLWDYNTGIYVLGPNASPIFPYYGANFWQGWEKPVSIEYFTKEKYRAFKFNAVFSVSGNFSMAKPQKSFEVKLSGQYGTSTLNYPLIPDKSYLSNYSDFILRNAGSDWMVVHFRDDLMERLLKTTDVDYNASEPCVVYLNGKFWGVYQIRENSDHHYIEQNFGYKKDQIDLLYEKGPLSVREGSDTAFYTMYNYAKTANQTDTAFYTAMSQYWDLGSFTDNFIAETYYCNEDWIGPWTNNIKFWRPVGAGGKWKYIMNDLDFGMGYASHSYDNMLDTVLHPQIANFQTDLLTYMLNNPIYKRYFINRYADLINTIFLPANIHAMADQFHDSIAYDMNRAFLLYGGSVSNWTTNINRLKDFADHRPLYARDYIQAEFSLTSQVNLTLQVQPAGSGRIQISTVMPESYPWSGVYYQGNPVTITAIPNPGYTFNHWRSNLMIPTNNFNQELTIDFTGSDQITAHFTGSPATALLTISEINYHSDSTFDSGDWIELHNYGTTSLDISNWSVRDELDNNRFKFPVNTVISAGGYLVLASDMQKFTAEHPSINNVMGPLGFSLNNAGEEIRVFDHRDSLYLSVIYQDTPPWPVEADGLGYTCELLDPLVSLNDGNNWFAGCLSGSPGRAYSALLGTQVHVSGNTTFCTGSSAQLAASGIPGYSYQWQRNHVNIPGATDSVWTATTSGTYRVNISYQGCSATSDSIVVQVVSQGPDPVVSDAFRCGPGDLTLIASSTDTVYWFDAPGGNLIASGDTFLIPSLNTTTIYYAQTSLTCPSNLVPVQAMIKVAAATPVTSDVTRCGPGTVLLIASDTALIRWYNSSGALLSSNDSFLTPSLNADTSFFVEAGSVCPSTRLEVHAFVNTSATPLGHDATRCGNGTVVLTASSQDPLFWFDAPSGGSQIGTGGIYMTPVLDTTTIYYVESNAGCPSPRIPVNAFVQPIPPPPVVSDTTVCGFGSVALLAASLEQVFWYDAPTGGALLGSGSVYNTPFLTGPAVYYAETGYICLSSRVSLHVFVNPQHAAPTTVTGAEMCGPGSLTLQAGGTDSIFWYDQPTGGNLMAVDSVFNTPVLNSTTTFYAVAGSLCPSTAIPVQATIHPLPIPNLGPDTLGIFSGQTVNLDAGSGYIAYLWSTGSNLQSIQVGTADVYSVAVTDSNGCSGSSQIVISIINGIDEIQEDLSWTVYPNPARNKMTIRIQSGTNRKAHLQLWDPQGRVLLDQESKLIHGLNILPVTLEGYSPGIYFIRFSAADQILVLRMTIQ